MHASGGGYQYFFISVYQVVWESVYIDGIKYNTDTW